MSIELKRIIKKKEVQTIIRDFASTSDPLLIQSSDGAVLFEYPLNTQDSLQTGAPLLNPRSKAANTTGSSNPDLSMESYPVTAMGEIVGWVCGQDQAPAIANLLSYLAGLEYEKKALGQETLSKYRELTLLYDITEKLASSLDPQEVSTLVIHETKKIILADNISLMLVNEENGMLEVLNALGKESEPKVALALGEGIAGHIALTGKAEILNDANMDARFKPSQRQVSSLMCAPLKIKDRTIGVINVSSESRISYTAEDLKLLSSLSLQAAAAIENAKLYDSLKETFLTAVYTLAETIEKRDPYTGGHTNRVMEYSQAIGQAMNLPEAEMERLRLAAVLHDVGKIGVRDNILLKNGKLTDEEFVEIRKHTIYGEQVLKYIKYFKNIIPGVKYHHERYDGKGYPEGLKGEEIDLIARIIAVGDTYDAMTTDRPYRKGLSKETAFAEIAKNAGAQFDPAVVEAFFKAMS